MSRYVLASAVAIVVVGVTALAFVPPHMAATQATKRTAGRASPPLSSPAAAASPSSSPPATTTPTVAGAATVAPATAKPTPAAPAPPSTPTPPHVNLTIAEPDGTFAYTVKLLPNENACSILTEAQVEGDLRSLNLVYYPSLQSDYVQNINGYTDNWTFAYNGITEPQGCSKYPLSANDTVTWRFK